MEKKFRITPRELILNSKDYSSYTKDELIFQYETIMNQYDDFKKQMTADIQLRDTGPNLINIKRAQKNTIQKMYSNVLKEVDAHLKIIKDLIDSM